MPMDGLCCLPISSTSHYDCVQLNMLAAQHQNTAVSGSSVAVCIQSPSNELHKWPRREAWSLTWHKHMNIMYAPPSNLLPADMVTNPQCAEGLSDGLYVCACVFVPVCVLSPTVSDNSWNMHIGGAFNVPILTHTLLSVWGLISESLFSPTTD